MTRCAGIPIGNPYSAAHPGVDYDVPIGTPIYAPTGGSVHVVRLAGSYGLHIFLHALPWTYLYAHLSSVNVRDGQAVQQGQPLGLTGSSGNSSGPHLHYEARYLGTPVDPFTAPCPFIKTGTYIAPLAPSQAEITSTNAAIIAQNPGSYPMQTLVAFGVALPRRYASRCTPPSGGNIKIGPVPIPGTSAVVSVGEALSYSVCLLTDVNTYIRLAFILLGSWALLRGINDLMKVAAPTVQASVAGNVRKATDLVKVATL